MTKAAPVVVSVAGREVTVTNPDKIFFPKAGITKRDLVAYYLAVAEGAVRGVAGRPMALKRYVHGAEGDFFFQKRAPESRPAFVDTVVLAFPSGRTAEEIVVRDAAQLAWIVNLGCIDLNPHPVRADDLEHPDELRIDLDPMPGVEWDDVRKVAIVAGTVLADHGLVGYPKTSGSRGIHVLARIERRWDFQHVRRAALAVAREVERRVPALATSKWWKEERHGVFLDYNQNAKDRTVASAYSVRPLADARVSMPLLWEEVPACDPAAYTLRTVPELYAEHGDRHAAIDDTPGSLEALLTLSAEHERSGLGDAPWPPHYKKQPAEPSRVMPSRKRTYAEKPPANADSSPGKADKPRTRRSTMPLLVIARAAKKDDALAGLERWRERYPEASKHLTPTDVLVDAMRGRYKTWTRVRVNLRNVPETARPGQEKPDPDYDPAIEWS